MRLRGHILLAAAALSLALAGCDRGGTASRNAAPGATGHADEAAAGGQTAQPPGSGLQGGLGTNRMGAAPSSQAASGAVANGSKNRTTGGSVGNR
jgi:hypothetical protein